MEWISTEPYPGPSVDLYVLDVQPPQSARWDKTGQSASGTVALATTCEGIDFGDVVHLNFPTGMIATGECWGEVLEVDEATTSGYMYICFQIIALDRVHALLDLDMPVYDPGPT